MTKISYYNDNFEIETVEIDKDAKIDGFSVTEAHCDLNVRIGKHSEPKLFEVKRNDFQTLQEAVNFYKISFDKYEKKSY